MTRKRKNVEQESEPARTFPSKSEHRQSFPSKKAHFNKDHRDGFQRNVDKMYGKVGSGEEQFNEIPQPEQPQEEKREFPTEIVSYLSEIISHIETDGSLEDELAKKCAEECQGEEATLLSFRDSCVAVDKIFGKNGLGAQLFLRGITHLKHRHLLDLLFSTQASKSIEHLTYAASLVSNSDFIELLEKFVELLCDNWSDAVHSQSTSFLLRCFVRVTSGLGRRQENVSPSNEKPSFANDNIRSELQRIFDRMADLALDLKIVGDFLDNQHCSLLVQEILHCANIQQFERSSRFLDLASESDVKGGMKGKNSSRVYEKALIGCDDIVRLKVWNTIKDEVSDFAAHPHANFPLQQLISKVESPELASEIFEALQNQLATLISSQRTGVIVALIHCSSKGLDTQESLVKTMRKHFNANESYNKTDFLLNVLTMNNYKPGHLNVEHATPQGAQLIEALLTLDKVKTLTICFQNLSFETIRLMATNRSSGRVLQAALNSPKLSDDIKLFIISSFENHWTELISHPIGSFTFDAIWECSAFGVNKKQDLMKKFVPINHPSRGWKFAMLRCDLYLFKKDRKQWIEKMKKLKKS